MSGLVPRIDTFPLRRNRYARPRPTSRCNESARFLSGILPTSSAVMASMLADASFFKSSERSRRRGCR